MCAELVVVATRVAEALNKAVMRVVRAAIAPLALAEPTVDVEVGSARKRKV